MLELGYATLPTVLARFIGGFFYLDHRSKELSIGWGHLLEHMVTKGNRFAWGSCMLTHLYHDMRRVVYQRSAALSVGVIIL